MKADFAAQDQNCIWSSIEEVITGTTGNRVTVKSRPRVRIPSAPPYEKSPLVGGFSHAETEWREKSCGFDRMQSAAFTRPLREMQLEEYSLQFHQKSIIILIKLRRILCCTAFSWMV